MSPAKLRYLEDRLMRDAARANVMTDVELLKSDMDEEGPATRVAEGGADYLRILADGAMDIAASNKGKVAGGVAMGVAGLALWLFREPILQTIESFMGDQGDGGDAEPIDPPGIQSEDQIQTEDQHFSGAD